MKLLTVTKLDKRNKTTSKNVSITLYWQIVTSLPFFQFTANLKVFGSRIPDAQSIKLIVSLKVTFYLTKTENTTKKPLTQLSHYCFD